MMTTSTSRDATADARIERLTHRFPELRGGEARRALAAGTTLGRMLRAVSLWIRRRREGVVTIYVHTGRA